MEKIILDSKELQKELGMTGYDIYQYVRRGLPHAQGNQTLYDLKEVSEWIDGFGERERKREEIKKQLINQLSEEEAKMVTQPEWNAQYAVVWGTTSRRQELIIQRVIYLMTAYSTSSGRNIVYLNRTDEQAKKVEGIIKEKAGEQANDFQSLTFKSLAQSILADADIKIDDVEEEKGIQSAIEALEEDLYFQKESSLKYRQLLVEELEECTPDELYLIQLLSSYYGDFMLNVDAKNFEQLGELSEWLENLEEIKIIKIKR